ncbi:MAG: hypothetical protein IJW59_01065 [Clostridia bacterium]|nr:hypothetical protein [Clostridia bacterium]
MAKTKEKTTETAVSSTKISKKSKLIISIVCVSIIVLGIITGIVATCIKRFDISETDEFEFYDFNRMTISAPNSLLDIDDTLNDSKLHSNATQIVQHKESKHYGVYSYFENELIVPTEFVSISRIDTEDETLFRASRIDTDITLFNDEGDKLSITDYDINQNKTYSYILEKKTTIKKKKAGVKVSTKNSFRSKKIEITDVQYIETLSRGEHSFEIWNITDIDGNVFKNIYKVDDEERELVSTLNSLVGANIGAISKDSLPTPYVLSNGKLSYITQNITKQDYSSDELHNITIYNEDFEEEDTRTIIVNDTLNAFFFINDFIVLQYKKPASEKKHDFAEYNGTNIKYYTIETLKLNLKNGNLNEVNFDYVINDVNYFANSITNSVQLYVQKIKSKKLENPEFLIVNKKLQTRKIEFKIENITEINDDVYLAKSDNGYYIIDEKFNKESFIGLYDNVFATEESLILSNITSDYTYVCNLEGTIAKRYLKSDIITTMDEKYYIVKEETSDSESDHTHYYRERLGVRDETPIFTKTETDSTTTFTSNDITYSNIIRTLEENRAENSATKGQNIDLGIITKVVNKGDSYTYEFYNIRGQKLIEVSNFSSPTAHPQIMYSEDDKILIRITEKANFETYIVCE